MDTELVWEGQTLKIAAGSFHGYQIEIDPVVKNDRWWSGGICDESRRGWLYPGSLGGVAKNFTDQGRTLFEHADWNKIRVEAIDDSTKTFLNGVPRASINDSLTATGSIGWEIKDGVLMINESGGCESASAGDIITREKFSNFDLWLDFRITEGANSGIKIFVDPDLNIGDGSAIGPEFQILDDARHPDAKLGREEWRDLVAISKYKTWSNFGELEQGHLLLQDHGKRFSIKTSNFAISQKSNFVCKRPLVFVANSKMVGHEE